MVNFAVAFVAHGGELEIKALLLAASLRKYWPENVELIGCVPGDPAFAPLSHDSRQAFHSLGVRLASVANPIGADYPIANKLLCLDAVTEADRIIFMDSDMLALEAVSSEELNKVFGQGFVAKPADLATSRGDSATWRAIYTACETEAPDLMVTATASGEEMQPYFNAGLIAVKTNSGFGREWSECAKKIDLLPEVPRKRPHLDQIALPVAAAKSGLAFCLVSEEWNFPAHLKPLADQLPKLCHYHWPEVITREPALLDAVADLVERAPQITDCAARETKWQPVAHKTRTKRATKRPRKLPIGVITGIPRSGTSYLCRLLHEMRDHVVISEPAEVFAPLKKDAPGHRLACYYRDLRRRILDGEAVENKTIGGKIIADTAKSDVRTAAPVPVEREDFTLWTKNTLAYLNRLPQLLEAMPEATFIACVRHPVDTIASWTRTFPHLRDAAVDEFPIGNPSDPYLSSEQRDTLAKIAECHDSPRRRAMLWNYLAGIILRHRDRLKVVRLEDFAAAPQVALTNTMGACAFSRSGQIDSLRHPSPELKIIEAICANTASPFGYAWSVDRTDTSRAAMHQ